jgi:hypothetical protein
MTSLSVGAAEGNPSVGAGAVEGGVAGVVLPSKADGWGEVAESCPAANRQARKITANAKPERTVCIRTFWESITLVGK